MTTPADASPASPAEASPASASASGAAAGVPPLPTTAELLTQLGEDRLWLLRQLDGGRWSEWRLDLAALERELGGLIDQAAERL